MGIVARQASWNTVLTIAGMGLGFVNMALLYPKLLTTEEFGLTRLLVSISVVAAQVAHLGSENTVIRYFPYFRDKANGHRGLFGLLLGMATVGAVIGMFVLALFHERFVLWFNDRSGLYERYGMFVLPLVFAEVWLLVLRGFSRAVHRSIAPVFAREFLMRALQTLLIAVYAFQGMSFLMFLALYVSTFLFTTFVLMLDLWRSGQLVLGLGRMKVGRKMLRSMARYSLFTFGSGLAAIAVGNIDQVMLGAMLPDGLSQVAYYAVAMFLASVIMVPARALMQPVVPLLAEAWRKQDHGQIRLLYHRTAIIQLVVSGFIFLGLWVNADGIFSLLPVDYAIGKPVMLVLGATNVISMSAGLSAGVVSTSRSYWFDAVSGTVLLVLNIALDYVLILHWGLSGAAWSTFFSILTVVGWRVAFLNRRYDLWPFDGMTLRAVGVIVAVAFVLSLLPHYGPPLLDICWRSTLLILLYGSMVSVFGIAPELGVQVGKLWRRLRGMGDVAKVKEHG